MSTGDDYETEMLRRHHIDDAGIDDEAIEAFFAGNAAGAGPDSMTAFAEALLTMAAGPVPVPSARLSAMLAEGFSTEKGDLPVTAASNVPGPARQAAGLPKWRKTKMIGELIAGLGIAGKAVFGVSVAAASVTAAGAAGVLPGPAQGAVAATVEAVTPFSFPGNASDKSDFGERVSTDARDGGVDGRVISEEAKRNGAGGADPATPADEGDGRRPAQPGQTGLDRANETPAAGRAPTSTPAPPAGPPAGEEPTSEATPASTGLGIANDTPAAGRIPAFVPPAAGRGRP